MSCWRVAAMVLALAVFLAVPGGPARAEKMIGPYYNPQTQSWFGLIKRNRDGFLNFETARMIAQARTYKGLRGRLAIVRDKQTHDFIIDKLGGSMVRMTLFGLRYWCKYGRLQWVDGSFQKAQAFGPWQMPWMLTDNGRPASCGQYLAVYYEPAGMSYKGMADDPVIYGNHWRAVGSEKHFWEFLIEFPEQP